MTNIRGGHLADSEEIDPRSELGSLSAAVAADLFAALRVHEAHTKALTRELELLTQAGIGEASLAPRREALRAAKEQTLSLSSGFERSLFIPSLPNEKAMIIDGRAMDLASHGIAKAEVRLVHGSFVLGTDVTEENGRFSLLLQGDVLQKASSELRFELIDAAGKRLLNERTTLALKAGVVAYRELVIQEPRREC